MLHRYLPVLLLPLFLSGCDGDALILKRAQEVQVDDIRIFGINLQIGERVRFETNDLSDGCDPVLHFLNANGEEVAFDDDSGPGDNAKLEFTPLNSGLYRLLVRAKSNTTTGTCNINFQGGIWREEVRCGGTFLDLPVITDNETVQVVRGPDGPVKHMLLVFKFGSDHLQRYTDGNFWSTGRLYTEGMRRVAVGRVRMADPKYPFAGDKLRVYVNDFLRQDKDHDGLGDDLETAIATCSDKTSIVTDDQGIPFECSCLADARDTDQDGLSDGQELLGKGNTAATIPLPAWGSDPRHKDLFVEVDHLRTSLEQNEANAREHMDPPSARNFAKIYADGYEPKTIVKLANAIILQNPDRRAGVSVHLDTGVAPELASDVGIYGDWGGYSSVPAIPNGQGGYKRVSIDDAWPAHMATERRGLFRYLGGTVGGSGQCGDLDFACPCRFDNTRIPGHEMGHTLGLGHSGPHYFTSYDVNCNPFYPSVMSYMFQNNYGFGLSSWARTRNFNNAALPEQDALSDGHPLLHVLDTSYEYLVDTVRGHVDWNRDGAFAPAGRTVRAYANYGRGAGCECTRYNRIDLVNEASGMRPVMARVDDRLYVFYKAPGNGGQVRYRYTRSLLDCPAPTATGCAGAAWSDWYNTGLTTVGGFHAVAYDRNGRHELMLVSNQAGGQLWWQVLTVADDEGSWSTPRRVSRAETALGEPALVAMAEDKVILAYAGTDRIMRMGFAEHQARAWVWYAGGPAREAANGPMLQLSVGCSPALVKAELAWNAKSPTIYCVARPPGTALRIWSYNANTTFWTARDLFDAPQNGAVGRPGVAWLPNATPNGGRLYIVTDHDDGHQRMCFSYMDSKTGPSPREVIGLRAYFDNGSLTSAGASIYADPKGGASRLRHVMARPVENDDGVGVGYKIEFRPKADGIQDALYWGTNDWESIAKKLARTVVNPGGTVADPIRTH